MAKTQFDNSTVDAQRLGLDAQRLGSDAQRLGSDAQRLGSDAPRLGSDTDGSAGNSGESRRPRLADHGGSAGTLGDGFDAVQVSDQAIMAHMRTQSGTSILDLAEKLAVTDTAVRQRLNRLMDRGLVERYAVREGRGRPKHVYRLTEAGVRASGANLDDLAVALWQELISLDDHELRERLLRRVVDRLAARYAAEVYGATPEQRLRSVVEIFNRRGIPFAFERVTRGVRVGVRVGVPGGQPVDGPGSGETVGHLVVLGCPYPGLKDDQRLICRMEQLLFQRMIGVPVEDITPDAGGGCCSFVPLPAPGPGSHLQVIEGAGLGSDRNSCGKADCGCR